MNKKYNFLIFMTDQQQGATLWEGCPCKTPQIDRLRSRGVNFTDTYCPAPHCCPSRATFFTGLYPAEHGVWNNVNVDNALSRGLYDGVRTFSQDLRENGYRLYLSGKWHISNEESPAQRGFEVLCNPERYLPTQNCPQYQDWQRYNSCPIDDGKTMAGAGRIPRPGYPSYLLYGHNEQPFGDSKTVQAAVEKLQTLGGSTEPFLLYVGVTGPHSPHMVPQRFLDQYPKGSVQLHENYSDTMEDKPALYRKMQSRYNRLSREEQEDCLRHYYAFCSYEDDLFGRLLDALQQSGHDDDTVVLFLSDHGDYGGAHGLWGKGLPCFREAYHICGLIGGPAIRNPGRTESAPVSLADFAPTILELAGIQPSRQMTGRSLVPFLMGQPPKDWRDFCFTQTNGNEVYGIQRAVWNKKWKYVYNTFDFDELYDLQNDPGERHNLIYGPCPEFGPYQEVVKELCMEMWRFAHAIHDNCAGPYITTAFAPYGPGILLEQLPEL